MSGRLSLPLSEWSPADRAAWQQAIQPPGFLEEGSTVSSWSQRYREAALVNAGQFLAWCRSSGTLPGGFADGLPPPLLAAFVQSELDRGLQYGTMATAALNIVAVARALNPTVEARSFLPLVQRLKAHHRASPSRPPDLIHPQDLYALGFSLMERSTDPGASDTWQTGLMVAMLTAAPVRMANFATLVIGKHLRLIGEAWMVDLSASETKAGRADQWPLPPSLTPAVQVHLDVVRPAIVARAKVQGADTGALWLSANGQPLEHQGVRQRIKAATAAAFGRPIMPHSFRHAAATAFALAHPERPRDAAALLGHAGPAVTEKHYILSERYLALQQLQRMMDRRRRSVEEPGS